MQFQKREWKLIQLLVDPREWSVAEIAEKLGVAPLTVRVRCVYLYARVGCNNRTQLLRWYIENYEDNEVQQYYAECQYEGQQKLDRIDWRIIQCICQDGLSSEETAEELGYRHITVQTRLSRIYNKLILVRGVDALRDWYQYVDKGDDS
jgi:DNA-binding NarL/FixJ family response regulator